MTALAANLEWLFTEAGDDTADRIRAAAVAGVTAVEIWGWRDKDIDAIEVALSETGVQLLSLIVDPQLQLTDEATRLPYLDAVRASLAVAERLGAPYLVAVAGQHRVGVDRAVQRAALVGTLREAAALLEGSQVTLLVENLNSRVDHVGTFLDSTREGVDIVREVASDRVRLLLDAYHALMMDENLATVIGDDIALVGHVQVADLPGRHEPGTGIADWSTELRGLRALGYRGAFGMEYQPTTPTIESLAQITAIIDAVDGADGADAVDGKST